MKTTGARLLTARNMRRQKMNKRQAKKRRKKEMEKFEKGLKVLIKCSKEIGEFLGNWVAEGMPCPKKEDEE